MVRHGCGSGGWTERGQNKIEESPRPNKAPAGLAEPNIWDSRLYLAATAAPGLQSG
jgi:hypothetical protein